MIDFVPTGNDHVAVHPSHGPVANPLCRGRNKRWKPCTEGRWEPLHLAYPILFSWYAIRKLGWLDVLFKSK